MDETEATENMKILTAIEIRERLVKNGDVNEALRLAELMRWKAERELELSPHFPPEAFLPGAVTFAFSTDANDGSDRAETRRYKPIDLGGASHQHDLEEMHRLVDLIFDLKLYGAALHGTALANSERSHEKSSKAFSRMTWYGSKAELGRAKNILDRHLRDCPAVEWGRHFVGEHGENMEDCVEIALSNKNAPLTGELAALKNVFTNEGTQINKK